MKYRLLFILIFFLSFSFYAAAQEPLAEEEFVEAYLTALDSATHYAADTGVHIEYDRAGPFMTIILMRDNQEDTAELRHVISWFDSNLDREGKDGEVIAIDLTTTPPKASGMEHFQEDSSYYKPPEYQAWTGGWAKGLSNGYSVESRQLLFADLIINGKEYRIRNTELIDYIQSIGFEVSIPGEE